jgi:hypothetical protein
LHNIATWLLHRCGFVVIPARVSDGRAESRNQRLGRQKTPGFFARQPRARMTKQTMSKSPTAQVTERPVSAPPNARVKVIKMPSSILNAATGGFDESYLLHFFYDVWSNGSVFSSA